MKRAPSPIDIALKYMEIFFAGRDLEQLYEILDEALIFKGPFHQFSTSRDYVHSLITDPPVDCSYRLIKSFQSGSSVNLIYEFTKPQVHTIMSQLFEISDGKITRTHLIFDSADFGGREN